VTYGADRILFVTSVNINDIVDCFLWHESESVIKPLLASLEQTDFVQWSSGRIIVSALTAYPVLCEHCTLGPTQTPTLSGMGNERWLNMHP